MHQYKHYLFTYRENSPGLFNNRIYRGRTAIYPYLLGLCINRFYVLVGDDSEYQSKYYKASTHNCT